jgi:hypothetical protein
LVAAAVGQLDVGAAGVLAARTPRRLAVADEDDALVGQTGATLP